MGGRNFVRNVPGHMTKKAFTPIHGKNLFIIFSRIRCPVALGLGV